MQEPRNDGRFSDPPALGKGTGNDVGKDLDPKDPEYMEKLAKEAGFKYTKS